MSDKKETTANLSAADIAAIVIQAVAAATGRAPVPTPPSASRKHELTDHGTHVATQRGYAGGLVLEEDQPVPAGIPVSTEWMREPTKAERRAEADADA